MNQEKIPVTLDPREDVQNAHETAPMSQDRLPSDVGTPNIDLDQSVTHKLEDGSEVKGNFEQAMKLCPVIGRMSREQAQSTFRNAAAAERAAEIGRALREARESAAKTKEQATKGSKAAKEEHDALEGITQKQSEQADISPETVSEPLVHTAIEQDDVKAALLSAEMLRKQLNAEAVPHLRAANTEPIPTQAEDITAVTESLPIAETQLKATVDLVEDQLDRLHRIHTELPNEAAREQINDAELVPDPQTQDQPHIKATLRTEVDNQQTTKDVLLEEEIVVVPTGLFETAQDELSIDKADGHDLSAFTEAPATDEQTFTMIEAVEAQLGSTEETIFAEEVMTAFNQLIEMSENIDETQELAAPMVKGTEVEALTATMDDPEASEPTELFLETVETGVVEHLDQLAVNSFETFVTNQPEQETPLTIEIIKARAADRPALDTFVQLALCLTETEPAGRDETIVTKLQSVVESVNKISNGTDTADIKLSQITPELVANIMELLQALGYQNPREAMIEFISQHDLEFLVQAIRYLYQLTNIDNQQEFISSAKAVFMPAIDLSKGLNIGRLIMDMVHPNMRPQLIQSVL